MNTRRSFLAVILAAGTALCHLAALPAHAQAPTAAEARAIAKEAYIYGFPLVDNYRIQYAYFVQADNPEYKGAWNKVHSMARVYTPEDKAIQTPNSDTPYTSIGVDLRTEPVVLTVPPINKDRYFSVQFIDQYTFNFAYVGSRSTGNGGGSFLLAGPSWKGEAPANVQSVIRCETEFAFLLIRTQLFNPEDIENVKRIQAGYTLQTLSSFLNAPAPTPAPVITFIPPLSPEVQRYSVEFFNILDFVLQYCPVQPSEAALRARFARIGIEGKGTFDEKKLTAEMRDALKGGIEDAWKEFNTFKETELDTGKISSGDLAGSREFLKDHYLYRMAAAVLGIYANSKEEAIYPIYFVDSGNLKLNGANRYILRFPPQQLPPVNAFWSVTLYELPSSLLSKNTINRYLINSAMLPNLKLDADGGLTIYIQYQRPDVGLDSNWLPTPEGPFFLAMRLYWPKPAALDGTWKAPLLLKVKP